MIGIPGRLTSLDVFRGATIAGMLLVNNPGSWEAVYAPLRHAEWDGCTPTDLVFPWFLFIAGVSMALSHARRAAADGPRALGIQVVRRSLMIFACGLLLAGFPRWDAARGGIVAYDLETLRIPGVLQRISWCLLIVGSLAVGLRPAGRWTVMLALAAAWSAAMYLLPVPGLGAGVLTRDGNGGSYVDRLVFGSQHLWVKTTGFDPEGLVSTFTAAWNTFLGFLAGRVLLAHASHTARLARWCIAGVVLAAAGLAADASVPINKALWTPSYVLWTTGLALLALSAAYFLVEVLGARRPFAPLAAIGCNPILVFMLSGMAARTLGFIRVQDGERGTSAAAWLYRTARGLIPDPHLASLACAVLHVLFFGVLAWWLWRRRWFLKL